MFAQINNYNIDLTNIYFYNLVFDYLQYRNKYYSEFLLGIKPLYDDYLIKLNNVIYKNKLLKSLSRKLCRLSNKFITKELEIKVEIFWETENFDLFYYLIIPFEIFEKINQKRNIDEYLTMFGKVIIKHDNYIILDVKKSTQTNNIFYGIKIDNYSLQNETNYYINYETTKNNFIELINCIIKDYENFYEQSIHK